MNVGHVPKEYSLKLLYTFYLKYGAFVTRQKETISAQILLILLSSTAVHAVQTSNTFQCCLAQEPQITSVTMAHNEQSQGIKSGEYGGRRIVSPQPTRRKAANTQSHGNYKNLFVIQCRRQLKSLRS